MVQVHQYSQVCFYRARHRCACFSVRKSPSFLFFIISAQIWRTSAHFSVHASTYPTQKTTHPVFVTDEFIPKQCSLPFCCVITHVFLCVLPTPCAWHQLEDTTAKVCMEASKSSCRTQVLKIQFS